MAVDLKWPDKLPLPTFDGYGIEPQDGVLRTDMTQGPARQRQQYTAVPEGIPVRWRFTQWQYALFRGWYKYKGRRGAEWFGITLLTGLGLVEHEARFKGSGSTPYSAKPQRGGRGEGVTWIVTAALEVRESPDLSEDVLDLALTEDMDGLIAAMAGVGTLAHIVWPDLAA